MTGTVAPIDVTCPVCKTKPGKPCHVAGRDDEAWIHAARKNAADDEWRRRQKRGTPA